MAEATTAQLCSLEHRCALVGSNSFKTHVQRQQRRPCGCVVCQRRGRDQGNTRNERAQWQLSAEACLINERKDNVKTLSARLLRRSEERHRPEVREAGAGEQLAATSLQIVERRRVELLDPSVHRLPPDIPRTAAVSAFPAALARKLELPHEQVRHGERLENPGPVSPLECLAHTPSRRKTTAFGSDTALDSVAPGVQRKGRHSIRRHFVQSVASPPGGPVANSAVNAASM